MSSVAAPPGSVLQEHASDPTQSMLGLRMMAAVHRLVLDGKAPALARLYPSAGGQVDTDRAWPEFRSLLVERREEVCELTARPCQTNEVGRSAALLGGFLVIARETGLPLRLLEIGASAGLNLCFDRYFYSGAGVSFGDPDSPVRFEDVVREGRPPFDQPLEVESRRGWTQARSTPLREMIASSCCRRSGQTRSSGSSSCARRSISSPPTRRGSSMPPRGNGWRGRSAIQVGELRPLCSTRSSGSTSAKASASA